MAQNATTSGALKTFVEGLGLSIAASRDQVSEKTAGRYITIDEGIAQTPDGRTPAHDNGGVPVWLELVQLNLWQPWQDAKGKVVEDYTLVHTLMRRLHGSQLPTAPTHVWGVYVRNRRRLLETDVAIEGGGKGLVHDAITLVVHRDG